MTWNAQPNQPYRYGSTQKSPPSTTLTFGQLVTGTLRIFARSWPYVLLATLVVFVLMVLAILAVSAVVSAVFSAGGPSDYTTYDENYDYTAALDSAMNKLMIAGIVSTVVSGLIAALISAPWLAFLIVSAEEVIERGTPKWGPVWSRVKKCLPSLTSWYLIAFVVITVTTFIDVAASLVSPYLMIAVALILVLPWILLDLGPWAVVVEGKGVIASVKRSIELAKPLFWKLLGWHIAWIVGPCVLLMLLMLSGKPILLWLGFALFFLVFAPLFIMFISLVFAELRAAEHGGHVDIDFPQPVLTLGDVLGGQSTAAGTPVGPSAPPVMQVVPESDDAGPQFARAQPGQAVPSLHGTDQEVPEVYVPGQYSAPLQNTSPQSGPPTPAAPAPAQFNAPQPTPTQQPAPPQRPFPQHTSPPGQAAPGHAPQFHAPQNVSGPIAGRRFNPPPGWPTPPDGFNPPPDWQPDPAWPPAPYGWPFWI